jgi:hypothetical protein
VIYLIKHAFARLVCRLFGCDVDSYSSAYMPDDYNAPDYCKRCGACHDVYNIETTDYPIIYEGESLVGWIHI